MSDIFYALKKPEVYSHDEIKFLKNCVDSQAEKADEYKALQEKLYEMEKAICANRTDTAIFFMPQTTYDIFSIFQGQNSICNFLKEDAQLLMEALSAANQEENRKYVEHVLQKVKILNDFLSAGNSVQPVPSAASEFFIL